MILIGSLAARARNYLPTWRKGVSFSKDIDLLGRDKDIFPSFLQRLDKHLVSEELYYSVVEVLDSYKIDLEDQELLVAPIRVLWSSLVLTAGTVEAHKEKNTRDLDFYTSIVSPTKDDWYRAELFLRDSKQKNPLRIAP